MLPLDALKLEIHKVYTPIVKLILVISSLGKPASITDIRTRSAEAGFIIPKSWNPSTTLRRSNGKVIKTPQGWELQPTALEFLANEGVDIQSLKQEKSNPILHALVAKLKDETLKSYLIEVIRACENDMYRSAIVMSWLASAFVLQQDLAGSHLKDFNKEMLKAHPKFIAIKRMDQLGAIKESEQLIRMSAVGMFSKAVKKELESCLDRRNSCGHPADVTFGRKTVEHHIEILLNNVFLKRR